MRKTTHVDGIEVCFSNGTTEKTAIQEVSVGGVEMSLETLLKIAEVALVGTDLVGSKADSVDPRYKFVNMVNNMTVIEGRTADGNRLSPPRFATMFAGDSQAPIPA